MAGRYREVFLDNGVEDLETILEMDEKHLEQMSVPLGHKLKIMKKIKEIKIQNFKAYTSQLEKQLDEMVYKLYELTEGEINVIENKK
jgi:hypothetical protein